MGIYSSGSKWKNAARGALASAQALEDQQKDVEFQRNLLSNIRQQRMAQAQLSLMNADSSYSSSSAAGASANIDSALAGEMKYSYETSQRAEDIQQYQQDAQRYMKKYAKQQKTRAMSFAVTGAVGAIVAAPFVAAGLGALGSAASSVGLSSIGSGLAAAGTAIEGASIATLASVGQGIGQIASNTGQTETGINNFISGAGNIYSEYKTEQYRKSLLDTLGIRPPQYELTSIDPKTGQPIAGSTVQASYLSSPASFTGNVIFN